MTKEYKPSEITAASRVPGTKLTYGQLSRVRRVTKQTRLSAGLVLAKHGAWDRKAVVAYVVYNGPVNGHQRADAAHHEQYHCYTVGLMYLGSVYADGRIRPSKERLVREIHIETGELANPKYHLDDWMPVEPSPTPQFKQPPPLLTQLNNGRTPTEIYAFNRLAIPQSVMNFRPHSGMTMNPVQQMLLSAALE